MRTTEIIKFGFLEFGNDLAYWPFYLIVFACGFMILVTSVMAHEIGHWLIFKYIIKKDVKLRREGKWYAPKLLVGEEKDYKTLTDRQYEQIIVSGIVSGLAPIIIAGFYFPPFVLMVIPYFWGARKDLKQLMERIKLEDV